MSNEKLIQGIDVLCKNDDDIDSLFSSRKNDIILMLDKYINEIELFNHAYGLVGTNNREELIIKHILDSISPLGIITRALSSLCYKNCKDSSLAPLRELNSESLFVSAPARETLLRKKIADAGSGAGLPGIPLAVVMQNCEFSLIERMGRRAGFLCNTKAVLSLSNISVEECEIEKAAAKQEFKGRFDLVTFRAFKPLDAKLLKTLFTLCSPNGVIAAYKGKKEKIETEISESKRTDLQWEAVPYTVPFLDEARHILTIKRK